jgi:hypothetical protein
MRSIFLLLAVLLLGSSAARAEDVPSPAPPAQPAPAPGPAPSVEEIASLLKSIRASEWERGYVLLGRALREAPDRAAFLERLATALRAERERAAVPLPPAPDAPPQPQRSEPPPGATEPPGEQQVETQGEVGADAVKKVEKEPKWTLRAWGVSVPAKEAEALRPAGATQVENENGGQAEASGPTDAALKWAEAAQRAADAEPLGEATLGLPDDDVQYAHLGAALLYRCCVVPNKGGAWAVETRSIDTDLSLRATKTAAGLVVEPVWVTVAQPIATESARPAPGVALELDRPDWSAARTRHLLPLTKERGAGFLVVPGLLPDEGRRLVLVLELRPRP